MILWSDLAVHIPQRPTHASLDIFQNNVEAKVEVKTVIGKKIRTFLIVFPVSYFKMSYTSKHHHQMALVI